MTRTAIATRVVVALAVAFAMSTPVTVAAATALEVGKTVPDFQMKDYEGKDHSLAADKGKLVVLSFTSIHCPYSKGAEPSYAKLAQEYGAKGVVFYSIDSNAGTA